METTIRSKICSGFTQLYFCGDKPPFCGATVTLLFWTSVDFLHGCEARVDAPSPARSLFSFDWPGWDTNWQKLSCRYCEAPVQNCSLKRKMLYKSSLYFNFWIHYYDSYKFNLMSYPFFLILHQHLLQRNKSSCRFVSCFEHFPEN